MLKELKHLVCDPKCKLFVGIGNVLKCDDGVGVYIAQRIKERNTIKVLVVEVSIENYIGRINKFHPDTLVLIDAVNFGKNPGFCSLLPPDRIMDFTTNTHNISLKKLLGFFKSSVFVLGIQPQNMTIGDTISEPVKTQADCILNIINAA